jgi:hypothetical protein
MKSVILLIFNKGDKLVFKSFLFVSFFGLKENPVEFWESIESFWSKCIPGKFIALDVRGYLF